MNSSTTPKGFKFVPESNVTSLRPGVRVRINRASGMSVLDWPLIGRTGTLLGFSVPHGFGIIALDEGDWTGEHLVHPEALQAV